MNRRMSPKKFTFPNVLSFVAILAGLYALGAGMLVDGRDGLLMAWVTALIAGGLCIMDGVVAESTDSCSTFGDEVLQPAAGLALAGGTVVPLVARGYWPWWVAVGLAVFFFVILQGIDFVWRFRKPPPRWAVAAKRHQFYLHPLLTIAVLMVALVHMALIVLGWDHKAAIIGLGVVLPICLAIMRAERVAFWLRGPK